MFEDQVKSSKRLNLLYDCFDRHVITNLAGTMARRYVSKGCKKFVEETRRTFGNRRVATACLAHCAPSKVFESLVTNATETLEFRLFQYLQKT